MTQYDRLVFELSVPGRVGHSLPDADVPEERRVMLSRGLARLSPARVVELRRRLQAIEDEFAEDVDPDGQPYGVVFAVYPMPHPADAAATEATDPEAADPGDGKERTDA